MVARRCRKPPVARDQIRIERFGERYIDGVISREILPQTPHTRQHEPMRITPHWKIGQIGKGRRTPSVADISICGISADDLCGLEIDQMRHVQGLPRRK
jgi:hypothetical protein